ncbi:MAG: ParB/RepB/Spo0J family partition protein, partial [Rubritepida sp.]|nr:ParB/RepB/Spo0J family partition protein [Rubritepida sp.]
RPGSFQARGPMDQGALEELAASIRRHGVLQPILVRPAADGTFEIIGGERRWRAAQAAQLHEVPVLVRDFDDGEAMAAGLVENLQREDLNALEEAEGYQRLIDQFGLTQLALSEAVGKSRPHISNTLRLLGLPERVRELVRDGALSAGHARAVIGTADPVAAALHIVDRGLNVRQAELLASRPTATRDRPSDPETRTIERELSEHLGLQVSLQHNGKSGQLTLRYRNLDQLDGLIQLLRPA